MPSDKEANAPVFKIDVTFGNGSPDGRSHMVDPGTQPAGKVLVCIAADVCLRDIELPLEMHVQMAQANQAPMGDVREAILQFAIEAGYPQCCWR
jgi:alkylhydroperoxidase/carboxymuconolactone decarboxylase family protein YurZ